MFPTLISTLCLLFLPVTKSVPINPTTVSAIVTVYLQEPNLFILTVKAEGIVSGPGWKDVRLVPRRDTTSVMSRDRLDLILVGEPPDAVGVPAGTPEKVGVSLILSEVWPASKIKPLRVVRVHGANNVVVEARVEGSADLPRQFPDQVAPAPGSGIPKHNRTGTSPPPPKDQVIKTLIGYVVVGDKDGVYFLDASPWPTLGMMNYLVDTDDPAKREQLRSAATRRVQVRIVGRVSSYPPTHGNKVRPETIESLGKPMNPEIVPDKR